MRIAMVSEHASPLAMIGGVDAGGQNVHVACLSVALAERGHEVVVYTRRDAPELPERVALHENVVVEHLRAGPATPVPKEKLLPHMDAFADGLRTAWRVRRPDVVHSHFWMSGHAALKARSGKDLPVAHTFHALGSMRRRYLGAADESPTERQAIERTLARHADHVLCTSTEELFELRGLGLTPHKASVVPCGVDLERFRPTGEVEARRNGFHRLVVVSRLVPRKGIDNVLRALCALEKTELVVAGGPERSMFSRDPEARRLIGLARDLGVDDRVVFRGRMAREDIPALLRSADVVVSTPWFEPFGMVPIEAMACGVPVVVSSVGGMIDTVVDGLTGLHVPPKNPKALALAIRELLGDPDRRRLFGLRGSERVPQRYGWGRVAKLTLDAYASLVGERRMAAGKEAS